MTDLQQLAQVAGLYGGEHAEGLLLSERIARFAALVADQCARECDEVALGEQCPVSGHGDDAYGAAKACAAAVRARFPQVGARGCPNCGIDGIHACPGRPIVWTDEDQKALEAVLADVLAPARGIDRPEGLETGTGSTAQRQEPGPKGAP